MARAAAANDQAQADRRTRSGKNSVRGSARNSRRRSGANGSSTGRRKTRDSCRSSLRKPTARPRKRSQSPRPAASPSTSRSEATEILRLPPLRPYQEQLLQDPARDVVCYSATQVGKTDTCACWILARAWESPNTLWGWYAPTEKQLRQGFTALLILVSTAGVCVGKTESPGDRSIRLLNGATITFASWHDPETLRVPTVHGAVVDEAGLLTQQAWGVISSRRSATLGPIRFIGNPGLVTGPFRTLCSLGEDPNRDRRLINSHRWTWRELANALACACGLALGDDTAPDPAGHQPGCERARYIEFIANEKATLPEMEYLRLYEAEWTADENALFRADMIDAKTTGEPWNAPTAGRRYAVGVDVGQETDYLVAAIWDVDDCRLGHLERWRHVPYPQSEQRLAAISKTWNQAVLHIELNGPGLGVFQHLQQRGIPVRGWDTTAASKGPAVFDLVGAIHDPTHRASLAPLPPLQSELRAFRYLRLPAGGYRYEAPTGMHDDCVMAALVGYQAIARGSMPLWEL